MNCQDIALLLDDHEVDDLLAAKQPAVREHLSACGECARDWQIQVQLSNAAIPEVPAALRARFAIRAAGVAQPGKRPRGRFVVIGTCIALAAAASILALQMKEPRMPAAATVVSATVDPVPEEPAVQVFNKARPAATAPKPDEEAKEWEAWVHRTEDWLAARNDPDALIATAFLLEEEADSPGISRRISALLQRAAALAPESARIQAAALQICGVTRPCDTTPYEQALRRIAPDNALGWSGEVGRASRVDDKEALSRALTAMSRATTYNTYAGASALSMIAQVRSALVAPPDIKGYFPSMSTYMAFGAIAATATSDYMLLKKLCMSAADDRTLVECSQIGAAMQAGDTLMHNLIGLAISGRGLPADSAEARALAQQEVRVRWIIQQLGQLPGLDADEPGGQSTEAQQALLGATAKHPREIDVMRALLEEQGIPTEPPADWKPQKQ